MITREEYNSIIAFRAVLDRIKDRSHLVINKRHTGHVGLKPLAKQVLPFVANEHFVATKPIQKFIPQRNRYIVQIVRIDYRQFNGFQRKAVKVVLGRV